MAHGLSRIQFFDSGAYFTQLPLLLSHIRGDGLGRGNDLERFDCLARESNRCFVSASSRMERVAVITCARLYEVSHNQTRWRDKDAQPIGMPAFDNVLSMIDSAFAAACDGTIRLWLPATGNVAE
jgi:hypothetical protein